MVGVYFLLTLYRLVAVQSCNFQDILHKIHQLVHLHIYPLQMAFLDRCEIVIV